MLLAGISAIFAYVFAIFTRQALRRGFPFVRSGWTMISAHASRPDARQDVEARRTISTGAVFFISGLFWLLAAVICAALVIFFASQAVVLSGLLPG